MSKSVVAENTKRIIRERGLKHRAVATWAGIPEKQFSALLNGRKVIKDTDVVAIANALCVTPNELFGFCQTEEAS